MSRCMTAPPNLTSQDGRDCDPINVFDCYDTVIPVGASNGCYPSTSSASDETTSTRQLCRCTSQLRDLRCVPMKHGVKVHASFKPYYYVPRQSGTRPLSLRRWSDQHQVLPMGYETAINHQPVRKTRYDGGWPHDHPSPEGVLFLTSTLFWMVHKGLRKVHRRVSNPQMVQGQLKQPD